MRLSNTLRSAAKQAGISKIGTSNVDVLMKYAEGNFDDFSEDEPIKAFYSGGPVHRGTGPQAPSNTKKRERIRPNSGQIIDGKVVYDGGFLNYSNIGQSLSSASNWLESSWLGRGIQAGWDFFKSGSGQKFIDNLRNRFGNQGGGMPDPRDEMARYRQFQSGTVASGSFPVTQFTSGSAAGTSNINKALTNAVMNPNINPLGAQFVASELARVSTSPLPTYDTSIKVGRRTQYIVNPKA